MSYVISRIICMHFHSRLGILYDHSYEENNSKEDGWHMCPWPTL